jgi:hypothetical protein
MSTSKRPLKPDDFPVNTEGVGKGAGIGAGTAARRAFRSKALYTAVSSVHRDFLKAVECDVIACPDLQGRLHS